ncbi:MAG TPA: FAD:protein FMN transferase [Candidatus Krumholzibacteria bacterium]|nr:FAD:protein FMN transferase [Candidatus Krumholzibacteria bacterium]
MPALVRMDRTGAGWRGTFSAMAGPCEVLLDTDDSLLAHTLAQLACAEARRIEAKFSRYRDDSVLHAIHAAAGAPMRVDDETAGLLDLAAACWELSGGRFDVTSGVLRRAWTFDGGTRVPADAEVEALRVLVGWEKLTWRRPELVLPAGMELDLGGLGKEYAVDRVVTLLREEARVPVLVNFGGDLHASGPRRDGAPWRVGVEDPGREDRAARVIDLAGGALATSGDARRYVMSGGERLGHILDPRTGRPVRGAPRSVTVAADACVQAGVLATTAMLHGPGAEAFLQAEAGRWWVTR